MPFQPALRAVTVEPVTAYVAFHSWVIFSPPVKVQLTVQPVIRALPAVTVTVLWKPPDQELTTAELALHPAVDGGAVVGVGVGAVVGGVVGVVVVVVVGGVVGGVLGVEVGPPLVVYDTAVYGCPQVEPHAAGSPNE